MKNLIFTIVFAAVCSISAFADTYHYTESQNGQILFYSEDDNGVCTLLSPWWCYNNLNGYTDIVPYYYYYSGNIVIPDYINIIGNEAFTRRTINYFEIMANADLSSVTIPNSVTTICDSAFYACTDLTSISIPNSVITIGDEAFRGCYGLTGTLTIPNSVITIGDEAFRGCYGLTGTLTIPSSVTSIGECAFSGCSSITSINFNATNCTTMGSVSNPVFGNRASNVMSLRIGENVTDIPSYAFKGIPNIDTIKVAATMPPTITYLTFDNDLSMYVPVLVPCGTVATYENTDFWDNFRRIQQSADCGSTGIDNDYANEITLFPNPATDILNITSSETISEIEIVNVMGQVVRHIEVNSDNAVCDVEDLKAGVYMVRIRTLSGVEGSATLSQRKFVKK